MENEKIECEVCGGIATMTALIPLWNYGVREVKRRNVCKRCNTAHRRGEL